MSEEIGSVVFVAAATLVAILSWVNSGKKADGYKVFGFVFAATLFAEWFRSQYVGEQVPFIFLIFLLHFVIFGIPTVIIMAPIAKFLYDIKHKK